MSEGRDVQWICVDSMPITSKGICKNNNFFSQVKDARMLNFTDFNGKDMALPLPSFEGATVDAL